MRRECKANGINISYEVCGSGEPLILLMGLGASGRKWAPHIEAYEKHFQVYAPDNRGAGLSDKPVSWVVPLAMRLPRRKISFASSRSSISLRPT